MLGWLKTARPRTNPNWSGRKLCVEPLEQRDNPSAPTLSFTASILAPNLVALSGQVTCDGNPTACHVDFTGLVNGSTAVNADGSYSLLAHPNVLGTIHAQATDGAGQQSGVQNQTITSNAPILTLTRTYGTDGSVTFSGHVTDEDQAYETFWLQGALKTSVTTDGNGDYSLTAANWSPGDVLATVVDPWGEGSNQVTATLTNAPSLTFTATIVGGNVVALTGQVTCDGDPRGCSVAFGGIVNASTNVNVDGSYSLQLTPTVLGTITARVTDGTGHQSTVRQAAITSDAPTITLTRTYGTNGTVILSGAVVDEDHANRTVTLSGAVNASVTTNANGDFTLTATGWSAGTVSAQTVDPWGLTSNTATATLGNAAPTVASFAAIHSSGYLWTFQGCVNDEYAPGLRVRLGGIPTLNGTNGYTEVTVGSNGWFCYTVELAPEENGTVTAQAWDWFGLPSNTRTDVVYNPGIPMG